MPVIVVVPNAGRGRALLHFCTATRCDTTELQTTVTLSGQIDFGTRRVPNRRCADTLMPGSAQFSAEAALNVQRATSRSPVVASLSATGRCSGAAVTPREAAACIADAICGAT